MNTATNDRPIYFTRPAKSQDWTARRCESADAAAIAEASLYELTPLLVEVMTDQQTIETIEVRRMSIAETKTIGRRSPDEANP